MKTPLMIAGLLCGSLLSRSNADEPASLAPIYSMLDAAAYQAQPPATLDCIYDLCREKPCDCNAGGDCKCDEGSCDCALKFTRTRSVTKPGGATGKLSAEAQERHDRRLARIELPADDPPPRPELKEEPEIKPPLATADAAPTPTAEVARVINWMPKPEIGFVDFGCGYDARWCVAAAEKWKCKVTGIEINPARASAARERVRNLGLDKLITIIEGDAVSADVQGDIAVAYLYPEVLAKLKPRLEKFRVVASYQHAVPGLESVPGLTTTKSGDTWFYVKSRPVQVQTQTGARSMQFSTQPAVATWQGYQYTGRVCTSPNCQMCNSIQFQLSQ